MNILAHSSQIIRQKQIQEECLSSETLVIAPCGLLELKYITPCHEKIEMMWMQKNRECGKHFLAVQPLEL